MNRLIYYIFISLFLISCSEKTIIVGDPQEIQFNGVVDNKWQFSFVIPIENNKNMDFKITEISLDTKLNNIFLGTIQNADTIVVKKRSNDLYTIHAELTIKNILLAATILMSGNSDPKFSFEGFATVESGVFKKSFPISYDPSRQPEK
jgi:LEA14-like dessication related protein